MRKNLLYSLAVLAILGAGLLALPNSPALQAPGRCEPDAGLSFICGFQNVEDLVQVPNTRWLLGSGMAPGSGLHLIDTQAKKVVKAWAPGSDLIVSTRRIGPSPYPNCPGLLVAKEAVLHGLALKPDGVGRYLLYATNHGGRESIEVFAVETAGRPTPTVGWVGCVPLPPKMAANSVAAFTDGTLLATVLIRPGMTFQDAFAGKNTGVVLQWTPGTPGFVELKGTELVANNGIETSPDDREFYVASTPTRRIYAFSRARPGGGPLRFAQLKDVGPDNVRWTSGGRLITAGLIDDEPACGGRPKDEAGIRCPMGYAVVTIDPRTMAATEIARGPRTPSFTGTAMAAVVGNELWLGSFLADRIAYRPLR
jgi:hypothetical protein